MRQSTHDAVAIEIIYENKSSRVATFRDVVVLAARTQLSPEALHVYVDTVNERAHAEPTCGLIVVGERTELPSPDVLRVLTIVMRASLAMYTARVIPGQGMWATALRGMVNTAQLASGAERAARTFSTVQDAASWLAYVMGHEATWRLQLTTMAGTLLYGSPSWNRASQMAPYLAGDDDEREP